MDEIDDWVFAKEKVEITGNGHLLGLSATAVTHCSIVERQQLQK